MTGQEKIREEQDRVLEDFSAAAEKGQQFLKDNEFIDLEVPDMMRLYDEFQKAEKPLLDAFFNGVYTAYSAGIMRGLVTAAMQEDNAK